MAILRGLDGTFYELPDDKAKSYEVPREKVKGLLEKHGLPVKQTQPGGPGGPGAPMPGGSPVIVQIMPQGHHPGPHGGGQPAQGGEVDPYWWWWNNWGNY